ncbi:MAG: twin-arginine translocase TatA/TatE family subunit [Spirochaetota bacterium]|nr:twin-arginine translocase TatA/TatE family subunit [Spirochaetota bacterium]
MPGFWQILLIIGVIALIFGAKRIPELARSLGKGVREIKKVAQDNSKDSTSTSTGEKEKEEKVIGKQASQQNKT